MKKIIVSTILIGIAYTQHAVCMSASAQAQRSLSEIANAKLFGYLNWHISPLEHTVNMCDKVERLINEGIDVNKKETRPVARFYNMTPLEVAITHSKCERCARTLRQNGAQDTPYIIKWQQYNSKKTT